MRKTANGRRVYALADYTVERTKKGWYFGRTSRFGDVNGMKGPYSSERSVALMIARELLNEIVKRDTQNRLHCSHANRMNCRRVCDNASKESPHAAHSATCHVSTRTGLSPHRASRKFLPSSVRQNIPAHHFYRRYRRQRILPRTLPIHGAMDGQKPRRTCATGRVRVDFRSSAASTLRQLNCKRRNDFSKCQVAELLPYCAARRNDRDSGRSLIRVPVFAPDRRASNLTEGLNDQDLRDYVTYCAQEARLACMKQAAEQKVRGRERVSFVDKCLRGE